MSQELMKFIKGVTGYTKSKEQLETHWGQDLNTLPHPALAKAVAVLKAGLETVAGMVNKYAEYQKVMFSMGFQKNVAKAAAEVRGLESAVNAWANSMQGASDALKAYTENITNLSNTQRKQEMEFEKFKTEQAEGLIKIIPIVGDSLSMFATSINKYRDQLLEQEHQEIEERLKLASQYTTKAQVMSDKTKEYLANVDKEITQYGRRNSMSAEQTKVLRRAELEHAEYYATLNASVEDAMKIMTQLRTNTGRALNMSLEATMKSLAAGKIVGDDIIANTQSELNLFNKSAGDVADMMVRTQNSVGRMGLSTQKVMKSISDNWKLAQDFQFKNGTQGLRDMTVLAENLRFNMSSMSNILSNIQNNGLEGVVKQSAQLQVLGGNIGMGADPFALAYNAFQDPKQMMENISKMLKGFGTFDRTTGETKFAINEQIRLDAFAKAMGMSRTDAMNMIRESNKKEIVKGLINDRGLNDEQMTAIANLATRRANGEWEVETLDGRSMNVRDVRSEDLDMLLSNNKEEQTVQYAKAQLSTTEKIEATTKAINAAVGGSSWNPYETMVDKVNAQTARAYAENKNGIVDGVKDTFNLEVEKQGQMLTTLNNFYQEYRKSQREFRLNDILAKDEKDITESDRTLAAETVKEHLDAFIAQYGLSKDQIYDSQTGTVKNEVYDSDYIRRITGGQAKFTPINESQMDKFGLKKKSLAARVGNTAWDYTASGSYDLHRGVDNWVNGREWGEGQGAFRNAPNSGQDVNIRDINVNDMVYHPQSGIRPIVTAGDVRATLSPDDTIIAMKKNGPISDSVNNTSMGGKVDVAISGTIRLDSNGSSIDLTELSKNPIFIRNIERMIAESRFSRVNGTHNYN